VALARGDCGEPRIQNPKSKIQNHIIAMGTLSKALGSQGGFVCATQTIIDTIVHAGRAYLFSTALAPASAAAALAALKLVDAEPARRTHLMQISNSLRAALGRLKLNVVPGNGPIIPILTGAERRATAWSVELLKRGIFVPAIRYPTVKKGQARLRVSLSAAHTREDCQRLIDALKSLREKDDA
jgi:8-amino-7-oxononanoate synthase